VLVYSDLIGQERVRFVFIFMFSFTINRAKLCKLSRRFTTETVRVRQWRMMTRFIFSFGLQREEVLQIPMKCDAIESGGATLNKAIRLCSNGRRTKRDRSLSNKFNCDLLVLKAVNREKRATISVTKVRFDRQICELGKRRLWADRLRSQTSGS
jgi:hypothetical protein